MILSVASATVPFFGVLQDLSLERKGLEWGVVSVMVNLPMVMAHSDFCRV
ncbi:MAG: hypothetical protein HYW25_03535 [Candidatus Aenigmarchaeota archaeon]|nr:hypothetical protein [Candidatus Aenigmarchaeota archaeon]